MSGRKVETRAGEPDDERRWSIGMSLAQGGDREAYAELMAEIGGAIEAYLRSRFGATVPSDFLEDCVQESLLAIHEARHTYDPERRFRPWLFTIVQHKTIDALRRQRVRERTATIDASQPSSVTRSDPSARLDGATVLAWLEPKYREALVLTKLDGLSIDEAAQRAGVSVTAMKTRVHRAIRTVQKRLRSEGGM